MADAERPPNAPAFDAVAEDYDRDFTDTVLGRALRARVWLRLAERFAPGSRVLELGCGTGADASWLASRGVGVVATDVSPAMLAVAARTCAGLPVDLRPLDMARPEADFGRGVFDGAFSNFGGVNCVGDLAPLGRALAGWLRPGARLIIVAMSPLCVWETAWHAVRLQPRVATRRWRRLADAQVGGRGVAVHYRWPGALARALGPAFRRVSVSGLGVVLPPSAGKAAMERHPGVLRALGAVDPWVGRVWPLSVLGDHYVLEMERRS